MIKTILKCAKCKKCNETIFSLFHIKQVTCSCGNVTAKGGQRYVRFDFKDGKNYESLNINIPLSVKEINRKYKNGKLK